MIAVMTSLVGDMSHVQEVAAPRVDRTVSFPELVRLRFLWRKAVRAAPPGVDPTAEANAFYAGRADFEREHGPIVNAYWCAEIEAAVALTEKPRTRGMLKRWRSPLRRFHRVSDYATRHEPQIARLLHQCDELAIRTTAVLGGRNQRICASLVMASCSHLLSLVDRPAPTEQEVREALTTEHTDFIGAQHYYRQAANGEAQMIYFLGLALGMGLLGATYLALGEGLNIAGISEANIVGCLTAGAIGAVVSVISRVTSGSFALDFDIAPAYTLWLGSLRPWLGSIFGLVIYFAITSKFLNLFDLPTDPEARFYFLCVVAFMAGFSERWAQDTLTGGLGGPAGPAPTATGPPVANAQSPTAGKVTAADEAKITAADK
jgi:hypothetical protein